MSLEFKSLRRKSSIWNHLLLHSFLLLLLLRLNNITWGSTIISITESHPCQQPLTKNSYWETSTQESNILLPISVNQESLCHQHTAHMSSSTKVQSTQPDHTSETLNRKTLMRRERTITLALLTACFQVQVLTPSRALMRSKSLQQRLVQQEEIHSPASVWQAKHSVEFSRLSTELLAHVLSKNHTSATYSSQMHTVIVVITIAQQTCQTSHLLTTANALMIIHWELSRPTTVDIGAETMFHPQTMGSISKYSSESVTPTPTPIPIA